MLKLSNSIIKTKISLLAVMFSLVSVSFLPVFANTAKAEYTGSCSDTYGVFSYIYNNNKPTVNGSAGTASIFNSTNCTINITLASYKMYDQVLANQTLYATTPATVAPGATANLTVALPNCMAQVDLFMGPAIVQLMENYPNNDYSRTYAFGFYQNNGTSYKDASGPFCVNTNNPTFQVTKTGPSTASVGNTITYGLEVKNTSSVTATNVVVEDQYDTSKLSFVSLNDIACSNASNKITCNIPSLSAGQTRTFNIQFNILGNASCSQIFNSATVKNNTVIQSSNTVTTSVSCTNNQSLTCSPFTQNASVNQNVTLYANGGNGSYSWSAPEANSSSVNNNSATVSYGTNGTKTVTVFSAGLSASCMVLVGSTTNYPNLVFSKKAWNDTKNANAISVIASREDFITYTLTVQNTGTTEAVNFVVTDDLSGVLPLADMVDLGGGLLSGQTITYPAITIPAGQTVNKTFRVRVKYSLANNVSYVLRNTYGNSVNITINTPPSYTPPKTGANTTPISAVAFAGMLTATFAVMKKMGIYKNIVS